MMPGVLEVAAVGVPDDKSGEAVKVVVVQEGPDAHRRGGQSHLPQQLTGYKLPQARRVPHRAAEDQRRQDPAPRATRSRPSTENPRSRSAARFLRVRGGSAPRHRGRSAAPATDRAPAARGCRRRCVPAARMRGPFTSSAMSVRRPSLSGSIRMSEKRMAASSGKRASGCSVTSQANSGLVAESDKTSRLRARCAVLREVATGLAHDPDRRTVDGLAQERAQQPVVLERIHPRGN